MKRLLPILLLFPVLCFSQASRFSISTRGISMGGNQTYYDSSMGIVWRDSINSLYRVDVVDVGSNKNIGTELTNAINATATGWKDIYLPAGTFNLGNANFKFTNKDSIRFWGRGTSLITTANSNVIQGDSLDWVEFHNIRFVGKHLISTPNQVGLQLRFVNNVMIEGCIFDSITIGVGVIGDSNNVSPTRISRQVSIINNQFRNNTDPISATFGTAIFLFKNVQSSLVSGNIITGGYDGIVLDDATSSDTSNRPSRYNVVSENIISSMGDIGILSEGSRSNIFTNNTVTNCVKYGLALMNIQSRYGSDSNIVRSNMLYGNKADGIYVAGSSHNLIDGNFIAKNDTNASGLYGVGIRLIMSTYTSPTDTFGSSHNYIHGNVVMGNTIAGIYLQSYPDSLNSIADNKLENNGPNVFTNYSDGGRATKLGSQYYNNSWRLSGDTLMTNNGIRSFGDASFGTASFAGSSYGSVRAGYGGLPVLLLDGSDFFTTSNDSTLNGLMEDQGNIYLSTRGSGFFYGDNQGSSPGKFFRFGFKNKAARIKVLDINQDSTVVATGTVISPKIEVTGYMIIDSSTVAIPTTPAGKGFLYGKGNQLWYVRSSGGLAVRIDSLIGGGGGGGDSIWQVVGSDIKQRTTTYNVAIHGSSTDSSLTVTGSQHNTGNTRIDGNLGVGGAPDSTLKVTGSGNITTNLRVGNNASVGGTFDATGNSTIGGTLGVTGAMTAATLRLNGATLDSTLSVTGGAHFSRAVRADSGFVGRNGVYMQDLPVFGQVVLPANVDTVNVTVTGMTSANSMGLASSNDGNELAALKLVPRSGFFTIKNVFDAVNDQVVTYMYVKR